MPEPGGTTLRQKLGCLLFERWQAEAALRLPLATVGLGWLDLHNRSERLARTPTGARECRWPDSSFLTVARVFPRVGGRLLARCLEEWPIRMGDLGSGGAVHPEISVVLPVGGDDRIHLLWPVLSAFAGQDDVRVELVVVEHALEPSPSLARLAGVHYVHVRREDGQEFNKSLVMNAGAAAARSPLLLLHDADIIPPRCYLRTIVRILGDGWDAVRPLRLIFHLDEGATGRFISSRGDAPPDEVALVQQNNPGASTAVVRAAYDRIGGHDEAFWGWGGEDLEFLDRLMTARLFPGSFVPAVHLWHTAASKKASGDRNNALLSTMRSLPADERIARLSARRSSIP